MTNRLVLENLKHRPVRTLVSALAIGVQVALMLTLVGLSRGIVQDGQERARGVGADIIIRPPNSSIFSFSSTFPQGILDHVRKQPGISLATGTLVYPTGGLDSITGIELAQFNAMSGGFHFLHGAPFQAADEIVVDDIYARTNRLHAGDRHELIHSRWRIAGIVEPGKMSRMFIDLSRLQNLTDNVGRLSCVYAKVADPAQVPAIIAQLKAGGMSQYAIYSVQDLLSQMTETNVPMLKKFTVVIIGIGMFVGFLIVFLSMYTAVLERTREIGILKALGASPGFILNTLLRETVLLALAGSVLGIAMSYGARWLITTLEPTMIQAVVPDWWPIAAAVSIAGALCGAVYPGLKAARQDVIDALAYD